MLKDKVEKFMSNKNLNMILDSLDEGIHIVDGDGVTIAYNKKASEMEGLSAEEVIGKNLFEVYPSLTLETSTIMQTLKNKKAIKQNQQTFINNKGEKITSVNKTVPIKFDDGETGAMEISRDITQLEKLVESIGELREKFTNCRENNKDGSSNNSTNKDNNTTYTFKDIIGESAIFRKTLKEAMKAAGSDSSVLLFGETGTGKELFAQSIHNASKRSDELFVAQNCAALPKDLLEGLLFGTQKGGFTGAKSRAGLFEQADGGTILLDEINSMDPSLQAKLLRVLQEKKVRRVGGQKEKKVDIRVIATINTHPDKCFEENNLRQDLFYRLSVVYLELPPLRKRKEDIKVLGEHFLKKYNKVFNKEVKEIDDKAMNSFMSYDWPGNVRELQHVVESAFNMIQDENIIKYKDLPQYLKERIESFDLSNQNFESQVVDNEKIPALEEVLENIEVELIEKSLEHSNGNISQAARNLNISRQSLQYKMKKYNIKKGDF
ncbi:MAG: sigma-54 interaction domain-containing protein [Bacillota bacterium]